MGRAPIAERVSRFSGRRQLAPGSSIVPKLTSESVDRIVAELMDGSLTKAERIRRLRELAMSGDDVPDELMDQALRKLMERITE